MGSEMCIRDSTCSGNCVSDLRKTRRLRLRTRIRSCLLSAVSGRTVRSRLPDRSSTSRSEYRHRDDGSGPLCRLQVLHCRLSLQRSIYQLRNKSGGQLRLLSEDQIGRRRGTRLRTSLPTQRLVFRRCERSAKHHQPSAACQRYGSYSSAFGNGAKSQIHHS